MLPTPNHPQYVFKFILPAKKHIRTGQPSLRACPVRLSWGRAVSMACTNRNAIQIYTYVSFISVLRPARRPDSRVSKSVGRCSAGDK